MQSQRLFDIIYVLLEKGSTTTDALAKQLEVSTRTIRRDIDKLSAAGIPVYMTRGKGGGVHLMPNFVLSKSLLSDTEQDEILLALQTLQQTGVATIEDSTLSTYSRLSTLFQKEPVPDWLDVDFTTWGSTPSTKEYFELCKSSIFEQKLLEFDYFASPAKQKRETITHRQVEAYRLIFHTDCWYLQAFCLLRNDWRFFKLSRMKNLTLTATSFARRSNVPDNTPAEGAAPSVHVKLRFNKQAAFRVLDEFPIDQVQIQDDGSLLLEGDITYGAWVQSYLLSYGGDVEVIEPEAWRSYFVKQAHNILGLYGAVNCSDHEVGRPKKEHHYAVVDFDSKSEKES